MLTTNDDEVRELLILEGKVRKLISIAPKTPTEQLSGEFWLEFFRVRNSIQFLDMIREGDDERAE